MKKLLFLFVMLSNAKMKVAAQFGFLGKVKDLVVNTALAPARSIVGAAKALGGGDASNIYKPYVSVVNSGGAVISSTASAATQVQNNLFQQAQNFVQNQFGTTGAFIFDVGTFMDQYSTQLANSTGQSVGNILQGENIFQIIGAPLAAAIHSANLRYSSIAIPLPDDVKQALQSHFPPSVLSNARYSIGDVEITLPNALGQGQKLFGNEYAVTVDNIIVFNTDPGSYSTNPTWWAHELTHVEQYQRWGVEQFAYLYIKDLGHSVEQEAINNAAQITNTTRENTFLQSQSYSMSDNDINPVSNQTPEIFVAQCFFPYDPPTGLNYVVTNYGRLIAVNPLTGEWVHYGYATAPLLNGISWSYQTPTVSYGVTPQGQIMTWQPIFNNFGQQIGSQPVQVGEVHQL